MKHFLLYLLQVGPQCKNMFQSIEKLIPMKKISGKCKTFVQGGIFWKKYKNFLRVVFCFSVMGLESTLRYFISFYQIAVNSLNQNLILYKFIIICPNISNFVMNSDKLPACLLATEMGEFQSQERAILGDSIAMSLQTLGITPLMTAVNINSIKTLFKCYLCR